LLKPSKLSENFRSTHLYHHLEDQVNIPAVLAAVVLSTLPILVLYVVGRRQLLRGLTAGFGK
jgi:ABC-type glycerol-3-phosphate transport system permease component